MPEPTNQQLLDAILGKFMPRFDAIDKRFDGLEGRFDKLEEMVAGIGDTLGNTIVPNMATRADINDLSMKLDLHMKPKLLGGDH